MLPEADMQAARGDRWLACQHTVSWDFGMMIRYFSLNDMGLFGDEREALQGVRYRYEFKGNWDDKYGCPNTLSKSGKDTCVSMPDHVGILTFHTQSISSSYILCALLFTDCQNFVLLFCLCNNLQLLHCNIQGFQQ